MKVNDNDSNFYIHAFMHLYVYPIFMVSVLLPLLSFLTKAKGEGTIKLTIGTLTGDQQIGYRIPGLEYGSDLNPLRRVEFEYR